MKLNFRLFASTAFALAAVFGAFGTFGTSALSASEPINIGSRLEPFVDDYLLASLDGAALKLHEPRDEGPVVFFDQPWEGPQSAYITVLFDGEKYRMYYRGGPSVGKWGYTDEQTCYAESPDGKTWTKPNLGLVVWEGIEENNIILDGDATVSHNLAPFLDKNPNAKPEERFKALAGAEWTGLVALCSADGIHWRKMRDGAVAKHKDFAVDSQNVSFWSEAEGKYVCYLRVWTGGGFEGFRTVARITSDDYIHWTPDGVDYMSFGETPQEHIYINQTSPYFRAPHIYLSTAARFIPDKRTLTPEQVKACEIIDQLDRDCSDAVFMSSRGGTVYDRTFMEGLIRPGTDPGDWASRANYPACGIVQTGPEEMSMYAAKFYAQPRNRLHRYSWRLDGIASINAPYSGGTATTKPLIFAGNDLIINASTSAPGSIRVEVLDETGTPIPGFELENSPELTGNWIEKKVVWAGERSVAELAGKPVVLRFVMKDADLYSIRFR